MQMALNSLFIILATVLGILALFILWLYVWEEGNGILIAQLEGYKKFSKTFYYTSIIALVIMWFCIEGMAKPVLLILMVEICGWFISGITFLVFSIVFKKKQPQVRLNMRNVMSYSIGRALLLCVIAWILNV